MDINLTTDKKNMVAEVAISSDMPEEEKEFFEEYMDACIRNDAMYIDTAGMSDSDTRYACKMYYKKNKASLKKDKK